ncbi:MaoC family dehydratase [Nocardia vinacea]|uniref:MaoC family dehydratase n=1 Tax=Nocardia vinacea TaxID=96468 RepID=A0ABZ1YN75_9NOCA|nr:MaoC family dehydratase [Nocardia vinacea]
MRVFASLDELRSAVGESVGPGPWLTIDQKRIDAFADTTGDDQWIHVDPERAATGPYSATIAHGYLTLSLIPVLGRGLYTLDFGTARINYGGNTFRFPSAVRAAGRIRATATFADLRTEADRALLTVRWTLDNEGQAKPACVAETLTVVTTPERTNS